MGWCVWAGQNKIIVDRSCAVSCFLFAVRGVAVDSLFGLGLPFGSRYYVIRLRSKHRIGLCLLARVSCQTARLGLTPGGS